LQKSPPLRGFFFFPPPPSRAFLAGLSSIFSFLPTLRASLASFLLPPPPTTLWSNLSSHGLYGSALKHLCPLPSLVFLAHQLSSSYLLLSWTTAFWLPFSPLISIWRSSFLFFPFFSTLLDPLAPVSQAICQSSLTPLYQ